MDENSFQKGSRRATFMIVVLALASILTMCSGNRSISTTTIEACGVCGREFVTSENIKSIHNTNMCKNCYKNFQRKQEIKKRGCAIKIKRQNSRSFFPNRRNCGKVESGPISKREGKRFLC